MPLITPMQTTPSIFPVNMLHRLFLKSIDFYMNKLYNTEVRYKHRIIICISIIILGLHFNRNKAHNSLGAYGIKHLVFLSLLENSWVGKTTWFVSITHGTRKIIIPNYCKD